MFSAASVSFVSIFCYGVVFVTVVFVVVVIKMLLLLMFIVVVKILVLASSALKCYVKNNTSL